MALACACDLVVAGDSARFTMAYRKIELTPDGTTTSFCGESESAELWS
jgi:2-(1,2-epoxy-1,2-dihydrophenyl)acetyl-CoA isomerase